TELVDAINATIARLIAEDKITEFVGEASLLADSQQ
ncbi:MAG: amino acid ABC transporter, partial [Spirochaetaceae bacterium]|nr:amino acid ABC transporter [Spirochaetaceae bacterium]